MFCRQIYLCLSSWSYKVIIAGRDGEVMGRIESEGARSFHSFFVWLPLVHTVYELEERRSTLVKYFAVSGNCSSDARLSVRLVLEATQAKPHFAISQTFIGMLGVVFDCVATKTGWMTAKSCSIMFFAVIFLRQPSGLHRRQFHSHAQNARPGLAGVPQCFENSGLCKRI